MKNKYDFQLLFFAGLDPTGGNFHGGGLSPSCAAFVQVIHTNMHKYGTSTLLGHADFFVNRHSKYQPGCADSYCSHMRAIYYYYASIISQYQFYASRCDQCYTSTCTSRFGLYHESVSGVFCLTATSSYPYLVPSQNTGNSLQPVAPLPYPFPSPPEQPPTYPFEPFLPSHRPSKNRKCCKSCVKACDRCSGSCHRECKKSCACCNRW